MTQIFLILQATSALLLAVISSPHATLADKMTALSIAKNAIQLSEDFLHSQQNAQSSTADIAIVQNASSNTNSFYEPKCYIDAKYNRLECAKRYRDTNPIVFLEGAIIGADGSVKQIKGINRDSAVKQLGLSRSEIPNQNPYQVKGDYATSSVSAKDKISVSIFFNNNADKSRMSCVRTTGIPNWTGKIENLNDHNEQFFSNNNDPYYETLKKDIMYGYDYYGNHIKYTQIGISVNCSATSTDTWYQTVITNYWDTMFVDFVQ